MANRRLAHEPGHGGPKPTADEVWTECGRCGRVAPHAVVWRKKLNRYAPRGMCRDCKRDDDLGRARKKLGLKVRGKPVRPEPPPVPRIEVNEDEADELANTPSPQEKNPRVGPQEKGPTPGDGGRALRLKQRREWEAWRAGMRKLHGNRQGPKPKQRKDEAT